MDEKYTTNVIGRERYNKCDWTRNIQQVQCQYILLVKKFEATAFFQMKKKLLIVAFFVRMFFSGIEYSVILPSAYLYMNSFNGNKFFMGLVIAVYPISAMVSLPIFGYIYDRTRRIRELMIILNMFQIVGNILYSLNFSQWLPITGRFVAGIGDGFIACSIGEITFLYPKSARIGILSIMELGRVFGLIIGPSLNFFISDKSYKLQEWLLDYKTLPGILMAFAWLLMQFITVCCVHNLAKELDDVLELDDDLTPLIEQESIEEKSYSDSERRQEMLSDETLIYTDGLDSDVKRDSSHRMQKSVKFNDSKIINKGQEDNTKPKGQGKSYYWSTFLEICSFEFLVILFTDSVLWWTQTEFELVAPYIAEFDYKWNPALASVIYVAGGILLILIFITIYTLGKVCQVRDSHLLLFSLILTQVSLALLIYENVPRKIKDRQIIFYLTCFMVFTSVPLNLVCSKSLVSKLIRPELQGIVQGLSSSATRLALIGAPLLSSSVFENRETYGAVASCICFWAIVFLFASLNRLNKRERKVSFTVLH